MVSQNAVNLGSGPPSIYDKSMLSQISEIRQNCCCQEKRFGCHQGQTFKIARLLSVKEGKKQPKQVGEMTEIPKTFNFQLVTTFFENSYKILVKLQKLSSLVTE